MTEPRADILEEGALLVDQATLEGIELRLLGGVAIHLQTAPALTGRFAREYKDLDLYLRRPDAKRLGQLFEQRGYRADPVFNQLNGHRRGLFYDDANGRQVDVFVASFEMCHSLAFGDRLEFDPRTLSRADLLLTKLQIVELNPKDCLDAFALLASHEVTRGPEGIDGAYLAELCAGDWGLWRTLQGSLEALETAAADDSSLDGTARDDVIRRIGELRALIEGQPKKRAWKLRSRVGERRRWYELPEEVADA